LYLLGWFKFNGVSLDLLTISLGAFKHFVPSETTLSHGLTGGSGACILLLSHNQRIHNTPLFRTATPK
jgi:hypothetical protein